MRTIRLAIAVCAAALTGACGGGDSTGPGNAPNLRGTFAGTWSLTFTNTSTGQSFSAVCPGTVTVSSQSGESFSGSFIIQGSGGCTETVTGTVSGAIRVDGGLNFGIQIPGGNPNEFEDITGCQFQSGDQQFNGTLSGNTLSVSASALYLCPNNQGGVVQLRVVVGFTGSR